MPHNFARRRRFETLETRRALAGNVTAALVGNDLVIDGDAVANAIRVVETANDGEFTITGLNDGSGTATSVNGAPNGSATIAGVTGNVIFNLLAGDDAATLTSIDHTGNLTIDAGAGNDTIGLGSASGPVTIGGELTVHVGDDRNTLTLSHVTVSGNYFVDAVGTAASNIPNAYIVADSTFQQNAVMQLGDRAGSMLVSRTTVGGRLELDNAVREPPNMFSSVNGFNALRSVSDVIVSGSLKLQSWGSTLVTLDNTFVRQSATIECFSSYNAIQFQNSRVVSSLVISTLVPRIGHLGPSVSLYDDLSISGIIVDGALSSNTTGSVRVVYSNINDATFTTEGNESSATIDTNIFGTLLFRLGMADDTFAMANSIVHGSLTVIHSRFHQSGPIDPQQRGNSDFSSSMTFNSNRIGTLNITGGNGTDVIRINYSVINEIFADLDLQSEIDGNRAGSDLLEITGSIVNTQAQLDGSDGFDLFRNNGSTIKNLFLSNFEAF